MHGGRFLIPPKPFKGFGRGKEADTWQGSFPCQRTLLWSHFSLFSSPTPFPDGLVGCGFTYPSSVIVGVAAQQASRPDLIRFPKRGLTHLWREESE
jgi:hypothetical protein